MQDESQLTEDSMRQALERFGSGKKKETEFKAPSSQERFSQDDPNKGFFSGSSSDGGRRNTMPRRRRFIGDNTVIVEHHQQSRSPQQKRYFSNRPQGRDVGSIKPQDNTQELYELKQALRQEQRKNRESQEDVKDLQQKTRSLETQIAHYRMQVGELENHLTAQQAENLRLKAQLQEFLDEKKAIQLVDAVAPKSFTAFKDQKPQSTHLLQPRRRRGRPPKNRALLERRILEEGNSSEDL